jgi:HAE1 family hydrophobic/amphiphilic exporter-1
MQWLAEVCVRRPVFATVLMLVLVVLGGTAYSGLGLDTFPNVDFPIVVVTTRLPGAAAQEMELDVSDKIESAVNTLGGIDELRSSSSEGVSLVIITFSLEKSVDAATQEVRDKVNQVLAELPRGIDPPIVTKIDPSASPVLFVAARGSLPIRDITEIVDKSVRRQLETIDGVGQVQLIGGRKRQIKVLLDPIALRSANLTPIDVQRALATQNVNVPGGAVESGPTSATLRIAGRVESVEELGRIVVRQGGDHPVRVEDVAKVVDGEEDEATYAQFDDARTVVLSIKKQSGKNTVAVVDKVLGRLDEIQKSLPPGVTLEVVYDNSGVIRTSMHAVLEHLVVGAVLAAVIVLMFLGSGRSTAIAAFAIPVSIIGTFAAMAALDFTLNFLTLLALALAVGLVIDDAIVVLENVVAFIERKGMKPYPAAILATKEIGLAVLATTLSLMAVFIPVAFMEGVVGRFLASFGLTMACAIAVSLLVSFSLTPMLAARWLKTPKLGEKRPVLERIVDRFYHPIESAYMRMLHFSMRHRWLIVLLCLGSLATLPLIAGQLAGGFVPLNDKAQFEIGVRAPEGRTVAETRLIAERIAGDARQLPYVTHALVTIGEDDRQTPNLAKIRVLLTDPRERDLTQEQLMDRARKEIGAKQPPELRIVVAEIPDFSGGGQSAAATQYAISGPDLEEVTRLATAVTEGLRNTPGAVDVDNTLIVGKPEIRAEVARDRAADLGVSVSDVATALQLFVGGLKVTNYAEGGEQYDVRVRADPAYRADLASLDLVSVPSQKLGTVPLSAVVTMRETTGPSTIDRIGRSRAITIMSNSAPGVGDSKIEAALKELTAQQSLPPGYRLLPLGRTKESEKMGKAFAFAFGMSFIFMYLILAAQFESWSSPFIILLTLPLTVPFALLSLLLFGQTINLFSMLGLLVLFGVVKKNAILQIDHTNQLRAAGMDRLQAILDANRHRLRPILMTTLAFVAGMIPLVLSNGVGAGFNQAMAGIVVGGQTLSLLLTLLATPVIYSLFDDAAEVVMRPFRRSKEDDGGLAELDAALEEHHRKHPH